MLLSSSFGLLSVKYRTVKELTLFLQCLVFLYWFIHSPFDAFYDK